MGMWLYSFCDILNYIFTQIFIINIQKKMIMQQTLFIVILAVVIVFALAYRWKKKAENKMGNDLNDLIDADDWRGVCRILSKQLIIWGVLLVLCIALLIARIMSGSQFYTPIIVCAFLAWRFFKLVHIYRISL